MVSKEPTDYGLSFPDAPGCVAMGETLDEVVANGTAALEEWVADEVSGGRAAPTPRTMDDVRGDRDVARAVKGGATLVLVPLVMNSGRATRANISLDAGLLEAIDEAASRNGLTRSAFLATAAREKISAGR